jgi:phosphoribosylanthranilate isomerase
MGEVKICGLSTAETMRAALDAGADFVGLVFYPRSPRHVSLETAAGLADQARGEAQIVALTVDADDAALAAIMREVKPDWIQFHGKETPERVSAIKGVKAIKAIGIDSRADVMEAAAFAGKADMMLFDAKPNASGKALPGGNGMAFDWSVLRKGSIAGRFMLSGGLDSGNVAQAIAMTGAPIVDVSSGVESSPGIKNVNLIRKFIEAAKASS